MIMQSVKFISYDMKTNYTYMLTYIGNLKATASLTPYQSLNLCLRYIYLDRDDLLEG